MIIKAIKKIAVALGYLKLEQFIQNLFRTRFATDMYISQTQVVSKTHEKTFGEYRNKYCGKEIVVIATGPSLKDYKPIYDVINIGVNKAFLYDKVKLDYLFVIDHYATSPYLDEVIKYPEIKKFYGVAPISAYGYKRNNNAKLIMPESLILRHNASKFYLYQKVPYLPVSFNTDIDKTWLVDGGSCIFSTMQFALFTNPKKIYIVGCDCSSGYFDGKKGVDCSYIVDTWKELKKFADIYYPETEIVSVNPVGLKGIFTDLYQK